MRVVHATGVDFGNGIVSERRRRTHDMILLGLGSNLTHARFGLPDRILSRALLALRCRGLRIVRCSCVYITAPLGDDAQGLYSNAVVQVAYTGGPAELLALLHQVERSFGRTREKRWAPRTLDLDLLSFGACVQKAPGWPILPHPRMHRRAFVLVPLLEIAPQWTHPQTQQNVHQQLAGLGELQDVRRRHKLRPLGMSVGWMSGAATNLQMSLAFPRSP